MGAANEPARELALGILGLVIDETRQIVLDAHARRTGQKCGIDAGPVHHTDVLIKVIQHRIRRHARHAVLVEANAGLWTSRLFGELTRNKMMLEVHNHSSSPTWRRNLVGRYCIGIPASLMTLAHCSVSRAMNFAASSGLPGIGSSMIFCK